MATLKRTDNLIMMGARGQIGKQVVFRNTKYFDGRVLAVSPTFDENYVPSAAQEAQREAFRTAVSWAKTNQALAVYQDAATAAANGRSPYNFAVADYLRAPAVQSESHAINGANVEGSIVADNPVTLARIRVETPGDSAEATDVSSLTYSIAGAVGEDLTITLEDPAGNITTQVITLA